MRDIGSMFLIQMAAALLSQALPELASGAGAVYERLGEGQKTGILAGIQGLGMGANAIVTLPATIIGTIINFMALSIVFIGTLYSRARERIARGLSSETNPFGQAFLKGAGLALAASILLFIANLLTSGLASVIMIGVLIVTGIGYLFLSLVDPAFLHDVQGTEDKEAYTSGFRKWSLMFWPTFILGMLVAIAVTVGMGIVGTQLMKSVFNIAAPIAKDMGTTGQVLGSL